MPELPKLKIEEVLILNGLAKSHRSASRNQKPKSTTARGNQNLFAADYR
jgi:hypothetical protein